MFKTRKNKTRTVRSIIIIGMFLLHAIAAAGQAGELVMWGQDRYVPFSKTPIGDDFDAVSASYTHCIAMKSDGSLVSWGLDTYGQISNTPKGTGFKAIAAGIDHSVAIKSDDSLISWGRDDYGQVSNTPTGTGFKNVTAGDGHCVALKYDGSLVAWGKNTYSQVKSTPTSNDFLAVAAGDMHNVALKLDGSIVDWGYDIYGQVHYTPAGNDFKMVTAGRWHNVALKSDGSLVAWGFYADSQLIGAPSDNDFVALSSGTLHSVALKSDGSLVAFGMDRYGSVSNTPSGNDFLAVAAAGDYNVAIRGTASPPPTAYTLNTYVNPSSSGYVTKNPDKSSYSSGELVELRATAYSDYTFSHWSGDALGTSNTINITMNSNKNVTANFEAVVTKPTVTIIATDAFAGEPANDGYFTVSRTGSTSSSLRVYYSTSGSTATAGVDYVAVGNSVDIPSGQSSATIYVDVIDDSDVESSETVQLTISSNTAYDIGSPSYATVTIADDEEPPTSGPTVTITAPDADAAEPANDGYFRISRTGDTNSSLRVFYNASGTATAGSDYAALYGYVYIPYGQTSTTIYVAVYDDSTMESSETVNLTVSSNSAYAVGSPSSATVTIADDDNTPPVDNPVVTITAPDPSAGEPSNDGYFRISRTGDTSSSLLVYYTTSGTASSGYDYAALGSYVYIPAGQSSVNVDVVVIDDNEMEYSESVRLTLSSNAAYDIGSPSYATVTITDDDDVPEPPVDDAEQLMADTLVFYYASIDDGSLVGVGKRELSSFQWMLEKAYDDIIKGSNGRACDKLTAAYLRCDGENDIPDYVTGTATATLNAMIQEVIIELGCI